MAWVMPAKNYDKWVDDLNTMPVNDSESSIVRHLRRHHFVKRLVVWMKQECWEDDANTIGAALTRLTESDKRALERRLARTLAGR